MSTLEARAALTASWEDVARTRSSQDWRSATRSVGQAIDDATGLPLAGATVTLGGHTATSDERGRYSFATGDASAIVTAAKDGMVTVERIVPVATDAGTVAIDARLTALA